ncbi:Integrase, catalytic region [hydrothermal vent metagenome]|uniref:Integrase, catalytic region n=1 Tax=hydrothermal vent metagenome TaxID=652676 RepID=A0A3B0XG48_9ZZZZ
MTLDQLDTLGSIRKFLEGNQRVAFSVQGSKPERYQFIRTILVKFSYYTASRADKGLLRRFLSKITGYSASQLSRLISKHQQTGKVDWKPARGNGFCRKYTSKDIGSLVKIDELHDRPCGQTIKVLCERAANVFGEKEYEALAKISVAHIYNLRDSQTYKNKRTHFEKTKSKKSSIGERRKPYPEGSPGYIRIDSVHQGDRDKQKGVYHINAVDEETQFEVICTVKQITTEHMIPKLKEMMQKFPFEIINFHSDNGSEYINGEVKNMLNERLIEFTKSRSRKSNDNALAESKNASVVRKIFGHSHIPRDFAPLINQFNLEFVYPYINFHKPCAFPETIVDKKGKEKKIYPQKNRMTPYEKLKSLPDAKKHLKDGVTFEILDKISMEMSDNEAAELFQKERRKLFKIIFEQDKKYA